MSTEYLFLRPYIRGWAFIALAMVLGYFIAERYLSYAIPMYQSTAKLKLADLNEGVPNSKLYKDFDVFANDWVKIYKRVNHRRTHSCNEDKIGQIAL